MKIIGVTGGIGSGKSTVCKVFATMGVPIFDADSIAKKCINEDSFLQEKIIQLLGNESFTNEGAYNKTWVAQRVFQDSKLLKALNGLVHPHVHEAAIRWAGVQKNAPFVLYEAALMTTKLPFLDAVWAVEAPETLRIKRVLARDPSRSQEDIKRIIAQQPSDNERRILADVVIQNDGVTPLLPQLLVLLESQKPHHP